MNEFEQGLLTYLSKQQLETIQSCYVGIGGCGGLGSNTALLLVRTGFRHFILMDHDLIESSNLNRQHFTLDDIGQPKAECLAQKLRDVNPDVSCRPFKARWRPDMVDDPFRWCTILVEAFDHAEIKTKFIEYYSDRVDCIVSGNGMAGVDGPPLRVQQRGNIFIIGDGMTDVKDHSPLAPRTTQCAAMMAEAILCRTLNVPIFPSGERSKPTEK